MIQGARSIGVVVLGVAASALGAQAASLQQIVAKRGDAVTRVAFRFDKAPTVEHFVLGSPPRAVIDMADTRDEVDTDNSLHGPRVRNVRLAEHPDGRLRAVLDLASDAQWAGVARSDNHTLVARIKSTSASGASPKPTRSSSTSRRTQSATYRVAPRRAPAVVVIDAGHGGHDPGTTGPRGLREKTVTLAISRRVAAKLDARSRINAVLTRGGDRYLSLPERRRIAQKHQANLFISIHANAYPDDPSVDGGSCYVLSKHGATNAKARQLARFENNSDPTIAGVSFSPNDRTLNAVLTDLFQNDSINAADNLAQAIISEFDDIEPLYDGKPLRANFSVLRDPMVPSVLCETAFLSNPRQARKLRTRAFRNELAGAIAQGVINYFDRYPPMQKSLHGPGEYIVRRGDTLSGIAASHATTVAKLAGANGLDDKRLQVGQRLVLPPTDAPAANSPSATQRYIVQAGDTLSTIAARRNTTVKTLKQANGLASATLHVGQKLAVPARSDAKRIVVDSGDTLSQIASHNDTSVERLKRRNDLTSDHLVKGQVLWLPTEDTRSS